MGQPFSRLSRLGVGQGGQMPVVTPPAVSFPAPPRASPGQLGPFATAPHPPEASSDSTHPIPGSAFFRSCFSPCLLGRQADRWAPASVG